MSEITITNVPAALRDWAVSWPEYTPADITPEELLSQALAAEVPAWAEGASTPADVRLDDADLIEWRGGGAWAWGSGGE